MALNLRLSGFRVYAEGPEIERLRTHLSIRVKDWFFARRRRPGWDGTQRFFDKHTGSFSRGLLPQVTRWLKANSISYKLLMSTVEQIPPVSDPYQLKGIKLKDEQIWMLNNWIAAGCNGIIVAPPGAGKTEVAAMAIRQLCDYNSKSRVLFVVNSLDLLSQAVERFQQRLPKQRIGAIAGGTFDVVGCKVVVATIQSLSRMLVDARFFNSFTVLIHDETHHSRSVQLRSLIEVLPNVRYRLGLSARPFHNYDREDLSKMTAEDVQVLACMGPVVADIKASDLIGKQGLARPHIYLVPFKAGGARQLDDKSWARARKTHLYDNSDIHTLILSAVRGASKANELSLVVVGNSRRYGLNVYFKLKDAGIDVVYLHGSVDRMRREWARYQANKGGLQAIVATVIYDEGVDLPDLRQLILAYGGLSAIKLEQRIGRSLRHKSSGQNVSIVVDFVNYDNKYLKRHSLARIRQYLEQPQFELYLVQPDRHPHSVKALLGKRLKTVDQLLTKEDFMELRRNEKRDVGVGVPPMAAKEAQRIPYQQELPFGASDSS